MCQFDRLESAAPGGGAVCMDADTAGRIGLQGEEQANEISVMKLRTSELNADIFVAPRRDAHRE